jgi:hypothetical protein
MFHFHDLATLHPAQRCSVSSEVILPILFNANLFGRLTDGVFVVTGIDQLQPLQRNLSGC